MKDPAGTTTISGHSEQSRNFSPTALPPPVAARTVAANVCAASWPSGSRAVAVTVALPAVTGISVSTLSVTLARNTFALLERAL